MQHAVVHSERSPLPPPIKTFLRSIMHRKYRVSGRAVLTLCHVCFFTIYTPTSIEISLCARARIHIYGLYGRSQGKTRGCICIPRPSIILRSALVDHCRRAHVRSGRAHGNNARTKSVIASCRNRARLLRKNGEQLKIEERERER